MFDKISMFGDMMFGDRWFDKNTYSGPFQGPVQIMRQNISNIGHSQTSIGGISPYHRYKGLSSIPNLARYTEDIPDTKYPIYKHYVPDMGIYKGLKILGYVGLADMKV